MNFYAVIIGTEILNGRRQDKHFTFVQNELAKYGHELFASFIIKDDAALIYRTYNMIKEDKESVLFSFGGIGSTPDDLTRTIASEVFRNAKTQRHEKFFQDIINKFGKEAYPHRIHMADLPPQSDLLYNPVNNMSGFSLDGRYFFTPGFPSMAHPMIADVIATKFSSSQQKYRKTLLAHTSENTLIETMQQVPSSIELSSLPILKNNTPQVELSLAGTDKALVEKYFALFEQKLQQLNIPYTI